MIDISKYKKVAEYKDDNLHWLEDRDINAVYLIMIGDDSYIGSSKYLYKRINEHLSKLKNNCHLEKTQKAFNVYKQLDVYTIERGIENDSLIDKECQYIRSLKPTLNINSKKDIKSENRPVGRPSMNTKSYHFKIEGELVPILDEQPNKNRFVNNSIREKMVRDGLMKKK